MLSVLLPAIPIELGDGLDGVAPLAVPHLRRELSPGRRALALTTYLLLACLAVIPPAIAPLAPVEGFQRLYLAALNALFHGIDFHINGRRN
jgi:hypothetical protein